MTCMLLRRARIFCCWCGRTAARAIVWCTPRRANRTAINQRVASKTGGRRISSKCGGPFLLQDDLRWPLEMVISNETKMEARYAADGLRLRVSESLPGYA